MASPAPRQLVFPAAVLAAAGAVWYLWTNHGSGHGVSLADQAFSAKSYDAYAWWATHRECAFHRNFPQEMGPSCLPSPLANQDGALSTSPRNNEESPYG